MRMKLNKTQLMSIFILLIMGLSVFGVAVQYTISDDGNSIKLRGTKFTSSNGGWLAKKDGKNIFVTIQPDLLNNIKTPEISLQNLNSAGKIYFSTNPSNQIPDNAIISIQASLFPYLNQITVSCTEDSPQCANLPLKTCNDVSDSTIVIQTEISDTETLTFENNCLLIKAPRESITSLVEAAILKLHGV